MENTSNVKSVLYVPYATGRFSLAARAVPLPCTLPGVLCPSLDNNVLLFVTTELLTWPLCLTMGSVLTNHLCDVLDLWWSLAFCCLFGNVHAGWEEKSFTIKADPSLTACFLCWLMDKDSVQVWLCLWQVTTLIESEVQIHCRYLLTLCNNGLEEAVVQCVIHNTYTLLLHVGYLFCSILRVRNQTMSEKWE